MSELSEDVQSLALQAFLSAGYGPDDPDVAEGLDYLLGDGVSGHANGMICNWCDKAGYQCAMAITALRSATKYQPDNLATLQQEIDEAQGYFDQYQRSSGGWRYRPHAPIYHPYYDLSVSQWPILALKGRVDDDLWSRVRNFLGIVRNPNGGYGYKNNSPRGTMTCAGIWGEVIAGGPQSHVDAAFHWLENWCGDDLDNLMEKYSSWGAQRHYYIYSLAKACALAGKTQLAGGNWYNVMYEHIDQWRNGSDHWDNPGLVWEPAVLATDFAILSLQVGTVPPDSRLIIRLGPDNGFVKGADSEGLMLGVTNSQGERAGFYGGVWQAYPGAEWLSTGETQELQVTLGSAETFMIQVCNNGAEPAGYKLEFEAYLEGIFDPADMDVLTGTLEVGQCGSGQAIVNGIEVISVFAPDTLRCIGVVAVAPDSVGLPRIRNDHDYSFQVVINEVSGCTEEDEGYLTDIDIFLSEDPIDMFGNTLPLSYFTIVPDEIDSIPHGGSVTVDVVLSIPDETTFDMQECSTFVGMIKVESSQGTEAVQFTATPVHDAPVQGIVSAGGEGLLGVPVFVIDSLGDTAAVAGTDMDGYYLTEDLPLGEYTVTLRVPLGYDLLSDEVVSITIEGDTVTVDFDMAEDPSPPGCGGRTNWFWAWQVWGAINQHMGFCYDRECIISFREAIHEHFDPHFDHFEDVNSMWDMFHTLFRFFTSTCRDQARSHYYALLLNVASGRLNTYDIVSTDGATVAQAIYYMDELLDENTGYSDKYVRGLARAINWDRKLPCQVDNS